MGFHLRNINISFMFFCCIQSLLAIGSLAIVLCTRYVYHLETSKGIFFFGIANGTVLLFCGILCGICFYQNKRAKKILGAVLLVSIASCICNVVLAIEINKMIHDIDNRCNDPSYSSTKKHVTGECKFKLSFRENLIWLVFFATSGIVVTVSTKILACITMAIHYENSIEGDTDNNIEMQL